MPEETREIPIEDVLVELQNQLEILQETIIQQTDTIERLTHRDRLARDLIKQTGLDGFYANKTEVNEQLISDVQRLYTKGKHMEILEKAIKEEPVVADAWKKVMVALRIAGFDKKENE